MVVRRKAATTSVTVRFRGQRCSEREVRIEMPFGKVRIRGRRRGRCVHHKPGSRIERDEGRYTATNRLEFTQESAEQPYGIAVGLRDPGVSINRFCGQRMEAGSGSCERLAIEQRR